MVLSGVCLKAPVDDAEAMAKVLTHPAQLKPKYFHLLLHGQHFLKENIAVRKRRRGTPRCSVYGHQRAVAGRLGSHRNPASAPRLP